MDEASRAQFAESWYQAYPRIIATGNFDVSSDLLCGDYMRGMEKVLLTEGDTKEIDGAQALALYPPLVAKEFQVLKGYFSKVESITCHPTWWGDFLHNIMALGNMTTNMELRLMFRGVLFQLIGIQDVYFLHHLKPRLLLEYECAEWAAYLASLVFRGQDKIPDTLLAHPLKNQFRFHPKEFIPSILRVAKIQRGNQQNLTWDEPLFALPALFHFSPDPQNFNKKELFLKLEKLYRGHVSPSSRPIEHVLLGIYITWAPNIHQYASEKDQKRIELFYLGTKLDQNSVLFGLPLDLFRRILEENYFLGVRHAHDTCVFPPNYLHGRGLYWRGSPQYLGLCDRPEARPKCWGSYAELEICLRHGSAECWGITANMWEWKQIRPLE
jgi:hypothetical protein